MLNVKRGYIAKILWSENIGIIRETDTGVDWIFFLDELTRRQLSTLTHGMDISFYRNDDYEQFVAENVQVIYNQLSKAV